ncbi:MAG: tRNA threonylcarbamoyladenosine biosynthesis protein TsaE [Syntrophus sp. SKADARSKE-3]|nr:tRNA threonylcarbamoyladenosine biosynthesis protein TsaE [Syntrophus sp. SKADARSKE-3]
MGKILGECAEKGDLIALIGDLGTGKTCLTQGIARGLGVPETYAVTSPTFTLINEYPGRHILYHLDVYRLSGANDMEDMGYEDYFYGKGVTVIEWAEKILEILPGHTLYVRLAYKGDTEREVCVKGEDGHIKKIMKALNNGGF